MMKNIRRIITGWRRDRYIVPSRFFTTLYLITLCLLTATKSIAKDYTFTWSANPEPVEGYKLHYKKGTATDAPFDGTGAVEGSSPINVGKQTTYTITGLEDNATYIFALTAYTGTDESGYSGIITIPTGAPTIIIQAPQLLNIKALSE